MKEIVILSGKGGTGKTTVSSSLAALIENTIAVDCDVDGSNMPIAMGAKVKSAQGFFGMLRVEVDSEICDRCGICSELCRFGAINPPIVDLSACEGCMVCMDHCPTSAIKPINVPSGKWLVSETAWCTMVHARLDPGEENSGKLVNRVRIEARKICPENGFLIVDGPPGIGCPTISSMTGCDLVVIVTEPSAVSLHDSGRLLKLARHMGIMTVSVSNKYDLSYEMNLKIEDFMRANGVGICGRVRFSDAIPRMQGSGRPPITAKGFAVVDDLLSVCLNIMDIAAGVEGYAMRRI